MKNQILEIKNNKGNFFRIRIVSKFERYGMNFCLTHYDDEPLVEVYDAEHPHTLFGQFVTRYNLTTLLEMYNYGGINLYGGEPKWRIDAHNWQKVLDWLRIETNENTSIV